MIERKVCEAPSHVEGCEGNGSTRDHLTPKCIGYLYGWSTKQVEDPMNIQYLSRACHIQKDLSTAKRKAILRRQLLGENIPFEKHRVIFAHENHFHP